MEGVKKNWGMRERGEEVKKKKARTQKKTGKNTGLTKRGRKNKMIRK